jgi:hypothetical protein
MMFHSVMLCDVISAYCPKKEKISRIPVVTEERGLKALEFLEKCMNITLAKFNARLYVCNKNINIFIYIAETILYECMKDVTVYSDLPLMYFFTCTIS